MNALTVLGPIAAEELGCTLIHEHLLFDFRDYWQVPKAASEMHLAQQPLGIDMLGMLRFNPFLVQDNLLHGDVALATKEVQAFLSVGGRTLVDPTNVSIGRDPRALQGIARATGLNIIMGSGYYIELSLGETFAKRSLEDLTEELIREVLQGVGGTGVRAGLIGEIGTSSPITANELMSLRSAARAQAQTGAPLMVHLDGWGREGHRVLDLVEAEGANPEKTILCHMNPSWFDLDYQLGLAERGAYIEYDMMGMDYFYPPNKACPSDVETLSAIAELIRCGFLNQLLLSQDVFLKMMLKRYGGLGYDHVFTTLQPYYRMSGISQEHLQVIFSENPQRVLAFL